LRLRNLLNFFRFLFTFLNITWWIGIMPFLGPPRGLTTHAGMSVFAYLNWRRKILIKELNNELMAWHIS
jgi:hypothetical protein